MVYLSERIKMYHYTYEITYINSMKYIGVRSCTCKPEDDKYVGSSKYTPNDKISNKLILKIFSTREEAIKHERYLQQYNEVVINLMYYNRAIQTSAKFDTTGLKLHRTQEHANKIRQALLKFTPTKEQKEAKSRKISEANLGATRPKRSQETKDKQSKALKGKSPWSKGKSFSDEYTISKYTSRCKYPNNYWFKHTETGEEVYCSPQQLGLRYGKKITSRFNKLVNGSAKTILGWKLR